MPTNRGNGNVEALLSDLTGLLADATLASLRAPRSEREGESKGKTTSRVFVGPNEVFQRVSTQPSDFTKNFEEIAAAKDWLLADGRANAIDLFVVFHPGHRVVPSPMEYGGPFRLSSALERDDRVWLIRPQSFFLQLVEDEYLLFPKSPDEHTLWPGAAEFWWKIRQAYRQAGIPLLRGSTSSGWIETAFHLFESMFDPELVETEGLKIRAECSFADLVKSGRCPVLHDTLDVLSLLHDTPLVEGAERNEELVRVHRLEIGAHVTRFTLSKPSLLLANLVEDLSEQRDLLSGALLQSIDHRGIDTSTPQPIGKAIGRLLTLLFPHQPGSGLSRSHTSWLAEHQPSFALVRWHPLGQQSPEPIRFFADGKLGPCSVALQTARMDWYLESSRKGGFTSRFISGKNNFPNVGTNYGPFPAGRNAEDERLLRPWVLTTDFGPFQESLSIARRALFAHVDRTIDDAALKRMFDEAREQAGQMIQKPMNTSYYLHYLLWYYERFLGYDFVDDKGNALDLDGALEAAVRFVLPTLAFPEQHFCAFTAPVRTELVEDTAETIEESGRPKMMTLSCSFAGKPLSSADVRMMNRIVDKLAELRTTDDALHRERQLRRRYDHFVGYARSADASREELARLSEKLAVVSATTRDLANLLADATGADPSEFPMATVMLESETLAEDFRQEFEALVREATVESVRVSLRSGRVGRHEQEHRLDFCLGTRVSFLSSIATRLRRWLQIEACVLAGDDGLTCRLHIPSVRGDRDAATRWLCLSNVPQEFHKDAETNRRICKLLRAYGTGHVLHRALKSGSGDLRSLIRQWVTSAQDNHVCVEPMNREDRGIPLAEFQWAIANAVDSDRVEDAEFFLASVGHDFASYDGAGLSGYRGQAIRQVRWGMELLDPTYAPWGACDVYDILAKAVDRALGTPRRDREFKATNGDEWKSRDVTFHYRRPAEQRWSIIRCRPRWLEACFFELVDNADTSR